jgi:phytoene desaturase
MSNIVVIGGGVGGLVTAARLAHAGHSVHVFEQGPTIGGKLNHIEHDGCSFETGPTLVTMPFVFENFFASVGMKMSDMLVLDRVDPACQYRWSDGSRLDLPFDLDAIPAAIDELAPGDGAAVRQYLNDARELYELTKDIFIFSEFDGFLELVKPRNASLLRHLPKLRLGATLHDVHRKRFRDPRIVQLFDRFATYNGSSPYQAPATLMVIPWVEMGLGSWYPRGGMYAIAEAVATAARTCGAQIHTSTGVRRILHTREAVSGVELVDGTIVDADHVVSNADVHVTRHHLLGIPQREPSNLSTSGLVLLASVERSERGMAHHNVFFADDYRSEFNALAHSNHPDTRSTVYISRSVHADPSRAADGRENWFVLVNAPPRGVAEHLNGDEPSVWNGVEHERAQHVLDRIGVFTDPPQVRSMLIRTPDTMAREWSAYRGSLYGASSNSMLSAFMRPRQRSVDVRNLWYVGGSAHPGGGIPLVATSGMIAADCILRTL